MILEEMHAAMSILDEAKSNLRELGLSKESLYAMDDIMADLGVEINQAEYDKKQDEADASLDCKREMRDE